MNPNDAAKEQGMRDSAGSLVDQIFSGAYSLLEMFDDGEPVENDSGDLTTFDSGLVYTTLREIARVGVCVRGSPEDYARAAYVAQTLAGFSEGDTAVGYHKDALSYLSKMPDWPMPDVCRIQMAKSNWGLAKLLGTEDGPNLGYLKDAVEALDEIVDYDSFYDVPAGHFMAGRIIESLANTDETLSRAEAKDLLEKSFIYLSDNAENSCDPDAIDYVYLGVNCYNRSKVSKDVVEMEGLRDEALENLRYSCELGADDSVKSLIEIIESGSDLEDDDSS